MSAGSQTVSQQAQGSSEHRQTAMRDVSEGDAILLPTVWAGILQESFVHYASMWTQANKHGQLEQYRS
eukprot:gene21757-biopygen7567